MKTSGSMLRNWKTWAEEGSKARDKNRRWADGPCKKQLLIL